MAKAKLIYAHLCDQAFQSEGGKLNLIGIFAGMNNPGNMALQNFPGVYSRIALAVGLSTTETELPIEVSFRGEDKADVVPPFSGTFQIERPPQGKEAASVNFNLNFDSFTIPKAGKYVITISSGSDELVELEFTANQAPAQPAAS